MRINNIDMKIYRPQIITLIFLFIINIGFSQKGNLMSNINYDNYPKVQKFDKNSDNSFVNYQPLYTSSISEVGPGASLTKVDDNTIYANTKSGLYVVDLSEINSPVVLSTPTDNSTSGRFINQSVNVNGSIHTSTSAGYFVIDENYQSEYFLSDFGTVGGNAYYNDRYFLSTKTTFKEITLTVDANGIINGYTQVGEFSVENNTYDYGPMQVHGSFLYLTRGNGTQNGLNFLDIYDISGTPTLVNSISYGPVNWHAESILLHNDVIYLAAGPIIFAFDISDPLSLTEPILINHPDLQGSYFYGVGAKDNILYAQSFYDTKLFSFNISDINNVTYIQKTEQSKQASQYLVPIQDDYMISPRFDGSVALDIYTLVQPLEFVSASINNSNTAIDAEVSQDIELEDVTFSLTLDNLCDNYNSTPPSVSVSNIDEDGGILTFTISIQGDLCGQETLTLNSEYQTMTDSIEIQIENYSNNSIETTGSGNQQNRSFSILVIN